MCTAVAAFSRFFGRPRRGDSGGSSPRIQAMPTIGSMRLSRPISMIGRPLSTRRMTVRLDAWVRAANYS